MNKLEPVKIHALQLLNGGYLIELPSGKHLLNGVETYLNGKPATFDSLPDIKQISTYSELTHYTNKTGESLTVDEYESRLRPLKLKGFHEDMDDDNELEFAELEDEYAYRKFIRDWSEHRIIRQSIERVYDFEIIPEITSTSPHILPMRHFGKDLTKGMFVYQRNSAAESAFYEFGKKYGYTLVDKNAKPKSTECQMGFNGLRYAKIGETYAFTESDEMKFKRDFVGNYADCEDMLKSDRTYVENKFLLEVNSGRKLTDGNTIRHILREVKFIKDRLNKIDSKNVTRNEKSAAVSSVSKLENELVSLITEVEQAS